MVGQVDQGASIRELLKNVRIVQGGGSNLHSYKTEVYYQNEPEPLLEYEAEVAWSDEASLYFRWRTQKSCGDFFNWLKDHSDFVRPDAQCSLDFPGGRIRCVYSKIENHRDDERCIFAAVEVGHYRFHWHAIKIGKNEVGYLTSAVDPAMLLAFFDETSPRPMPSEVWFMLEKLLENFPHKQW